MAPLIALLAATALLTLVGLAALARGAETRDGFAELPHVATGSAG